MSNEPIVPETFTMDKRSNTFIQGQRIYYLLYNPKPFTSDAVRLQILKLNKIAPSYGITIAQGRDVEIDPNKNYFTDYFCLHQEGSYMLRIFSKDKLENPIAQAGFEVVSP